MVGGAQEDDGVPLLDQAGDLPVLLDDPGAGAVDDVEAALLGCLHDLRGDAMGADDHGRPGLHPSMVSTVRMPRARRSLMTPSLWTVWPSVRVSLPSAADVRAWSIASRTP